MQGEYQMNTSELFSVIRERFAAVAAAAGIPGCEDKISVYPLTADEILGSAERRDFPILSGRETLEQAEFRGGFGQAFTAHPVKGEFTVDELLTMETDSLRGQGTFIAGVNAVMNSLGLIKNTVHCTDEGPECCGKTAADALWREFGDVKVALIGYQPCLLANLSGRFSRLRITDLSPDKVGTERCGVKVEHGVYDRESVCDWAELILCTGSTLTNGTFCDFYRYAAEGRKILFYGTTIAGAAQLLGLERLCWADGNGK